MCFKLSLLKNRVLKNQYRYTFNEQLFVFEIIEEFHGNARVFANYRERLGRRYK